jgi:hypothetical protein
MAETKTNNVTSTQVVVTHLARKLKLLAAAQAGVQLSSKPEDVQEVTEADAKGGSGSGNFNHSGRLGKVGGSAAHSGLAVDAHRSPLTDLGYREFYSGNDREGDNKATFSWMKDNCIPESEWNLDAWDFRKQGVPPKWRMGATILQRVLQSPEGSGPMNSFLRQGYEPKDTHRTDLSPEIRKRMDDASDIDTVFEKAHLSENIIAYRGIKSAAFTQDITSRVGQVISDKAFLSVSLDPRMVMEYGATWDPRNKKIPEVVHVARIRLPKGAPGWINYGIYVPSHKKEIVLPRNSHLRVLGIQDKLMRFSNANRPAPTRVIEMEYVNE